MTDATDITYRLRVTTHREAIYDISGATTPEEALNAAMEYEQAFIEGMGQVSEDESILKYIEVESASMEDEPDDTLTIRNNGAVASASGWVAWNGYLDEDFDDDDITAARFYRADDEDWQRAVDLDDDHAVHDRTPAASA